MPQSGQMALSVCLTRPRSDMLNAAATEHVLIRVATEVTAGTIAALEVVDITVTDECQQ